MWLKSWFEIGLNLKKGSIWLGFFSNLFTLIWMGLKWRGITLEHLIVDVETIIFNQLKQQSYWTYRPSTYKGLTGFSYRWGRIFLFFLFLHFLWHWGPHQGERNERGGLYQTWERSIFLETRYMNNYYNCIWKFKLKKIVLYFLFLWSITFHELNCQTHSKRRELKPKQYIQLYVEKWKVWKMVTNKEYQINGCTACMIYNFTE